MPKIPLSDNFGTQKREAAVRGPFWGQKCPLCGRFCLRNEIGGFGSCWYAT